MKHFYLVLVLSFLSFSLPCFAQTTSTSGDDAKLKALEQATAYLQGSAEVKALGLSAEQVTAYAMGIVDVTDDAARRITRLRKDPDSFKELLEISKRIQQTRAQLATGLDAAARSKALTQLSVDLNLAQASVALFKTEEGPTSTLLSSPEGRKRAKELAEQALALAPDSIPARYKLGDALYADRQFEEAEKEFRKGLAAATNSVDQNKLGHDKLGNALMSQMKYPDAITEFREAIRLDPADFEAHSDIGLALKAQRNLDAAIAEFREAIRINPDFADGHNNLGVALANQGRVPAAILEFQEIIRIHPDAALGHYNVAIALADMEKDLESIAEFRIVLRINPNQYNAHYDMADLLRLHGEIEESAREFREYVRLAPDNPQTRRNIDRAKTLIKAFEEP